MLLFNFQVRLQYEIFPENTEQASRQIILINNVEVRDRLLSSRIHKLLYHYTSETLPRQSHANMVKKTNKWNIKKNTVLMYSGLTLKDTLETTPLSVGHKFLAASII